MSSANSDELPVDTHTHTHTHTFTAYLSYLFEGFRVEVGEDVAIGLREDLEGHSTVMVLQRRDVVVANCQLRSGIDLVPKREREKKKEKEKAGQKDRQTDRQTRGKRWMQRGRRVRNMREEYKSKGGK